MVKSDLLVKYIRFGPETQRILCTLRHYGGSLKSNFVVGCQEIAGFEYMKIVTLRERASQIYQFWPFPLGLRQNVALMTHLNVAKYIGIVEFQAKIGYFLLIESISQVFQLPPQ